MKEKEKKRKVAKRKRVSENWRIEREKKRKRPRGNSMARATGWFRDKRDKMPGFADEIAKAFIFFLIVRNVS